MGRLFMKAVSKRDFIQQTSKFLKIAQSSGIVITYHRKPCLIIHPVKTKTIDDLQGFTKVTIKGDINDPILEDFTKW